MDKISPTFASLFTGFGGADLGAIAANFTPIWGVEFAQDIADVAHKNGGDVLKEVADQVNAGALGPNVTATVTPSPRNKKTR